jgi:hypothetical protein
MSAASIPLFCLGIWLNRTGKAFAAVLSVSLICSPAFAQQPGAARRFDANDVRRSLKPTSPFAVL